jgi:hypothetical protein
VASAVVSRLDILLAWTIQVDLRSSSLEATGRRYRLVVICMVIIEATEL